jgi:hypothetical protein
MADPVRRCDVLVHGCTLCGHFERPAAVAAGSAALEAAPEDWEAPDAGFEAHVGEVVRVRLGRHLLAAPGPAGITPDDAHALYAKVTSEILGKERQVRRATQWYPHRLRLALQRVWCGHLPHKPFA